MRVTQNEQKKPGPSVLFSFFSIKKICVP
ncbi:unnamed protein product, partial [Larinioides sclopetarius]